MNIKRYPAAIRAQYYRRLRNKALLKEFADAPIVESASETLAGERIPLLIFQDGLRLSGHSPRQVDIELLRKYRNRIPDTITDETISIAIDYVTRFLYPHAMPQITMPYPHRTRRGFHPQHRETLREHALNETATRHLDELFTPGPDDVFLDVGAFMGYGSLRMAREIGKDGMVLAVEAEPVNQTIIERNIQLNNIENITLIKRAIWNSDESEMTFHQNTEQQNSLISDIIQAKGSVSVKTITIDSIQSDYTDRPINAISLTVNGAEVEAVEGGLKTLAAAKDIRLSAAGWYRREQGRIADVIRPSLEGAGLKVSVSHGGGVVAWKSSANRQSD